MIVVYVETSAMRSAVGALANGRECQWTDVRRQFAASLARATAGVVAVPDFGAEEAEWLLRTFGGHDAGPRCVVVTPLSLQALQRFRSLTPRGFRVVWAEEAVERLPIVVGEIEAQGRHPLRLLGERIVRGYDLRPPVRDAVSHICQLPISLSPPPGIFRASGTFRDLVAELDGLGRIDVSSFHRWWGGEVPSEPGFVELLGWALLLFETRAGAEGRPDAAPLEELGLRPGTLDRCCLRLLGCTLTAARRRPQLVWRGYEEWTNETRIFGSSHPPPPTSVGALAMLVGSTPTVFRRNWRAEVPLACGPKRLLSWAALCWVLEQHERGKSWGSTVSRAGSSRRTLERSCIHLAGCTLLAAGRDPDEVRRRFREWVAQVGALRQS